MARIEAVLPCHLQLVHSEVRLISAMDGKILGLWPFKCIRRYKFVGNLFSIEAGRKAPTGEGIFEFISNECSEIYRVMDTIIRTKAGSTTTRRFASERIHKQIQQEHQPVKKVNSVPVSTKNEVRYDYANPKVQSMVSRPPPLSLPLPSKPDSPSIQSDPTYDILSPGIATVDGKVSRRPPPSLPLPNKPDSPSIQSDPTYNILSPGIANVDGKVLKQNGTPSNDYEYNTLQFKSSPTEGQSPLQNVSKMAGSLGSYDTLTFTKDTSSKDETLKAKGLDRQYDTLQFGERKDSMDNELQNSSGSFYSMLDHSSGSLGSTGSVSGNTYDSLHSGSGPQSGDVSGTYDALGKPRPPTSLELGNNTYDALQHENQKPSSKESPSTQRKPTTLGVAPLKPAKPPPRRKPPSTPKQAEARKTCDAVQDKPNVPTHAPPRTISAGTKAEKPMKAPRKNATEAKEVERPKGESISEVIQKRIANHEPQVDDSGYATVDHEYSSIDYSKVSRSDSADSSDIYVDPDEDDIRGTPIPKPQQTKPAKPPRNNAQQIKNLFKKVPKPKADRQGGNFADELRKKLEIKIKKTGGRKSGQTKIGHQTGQSGIDDDIYDEVHDPQDPYYSEPDSYSEPAV